MKLFWKDHIPLLIIYFLQMGATILIYWLDGCTNVNTALYTMLLSSFILAAYLAFRYISQSSYYRRLANPMETLDESIQPDGHSPLSIALEELLKTQYRHFRTQLHQYEKKLRDQLTFIYQWVHQMKTPLAVIHLTLEEQDEPVFDSIREEADRIGKGLETMLYVARLDNFEQDFQVEPVRLRKLTDEFVQANKRLFIRNQVFPEIKVDPEVAVQSDEKWLAFVLGQILTNAVKYSKGKSKTVEVASYFRGNHVVLQVKDYGIGIPKHDVKRVFDPYFTGENGRKFPEATGMGLYLVKEICRRLDHRIELESIEGEGTTVRIVFSSMAASEGS